MKNLSVLGVIVLMGLMLVSCGGGDENGETTSAPQGVDAAKTGADPGGTTGAQLPPPKDPSVNYQGESRAAVAAVVQMYVAMSEADGETACSLQTVRLQRTFEQVEGNVRSEFKGKSCGEIRSEITSRYPPAMLRKFRDLTIKRVTVNGNRATVVHLVPDIDPTHTTKVFTSVPLRREGGEWKVDG